MRKPSSKTGCERSGNCVTNRLPSARTSWGVRPPERGGHADVLGADPERQLGLHHRLQPCQGAGNVAAVLRPATDHRRQVLLQPRLQIFLPPYRPQSWPARPGLKDVVRNVSGRKPDAAGSEVPRHPQRLPADRLLQHVEQRAGEQVHVLCHLLGLPAFPSLPQDGDFVPEVVKRLLCRQVRIQAPGIHGVEIQLFGKQGRRRTRLAELHRI